MTTDEDRTTKYREASRRLLAQGLHEFSGGDLQQASEKGWGAAAEMIKAVAESRGWQHNSHERLRRIVSWLVEETRDREMSTLFGAASSLHTNYYENWSPWPEVRDGLEDVGRFVDKLEALLE